MVNIPKCLIEYRDIIRTLAELESYRESFGEQPKDFGLAMEIKFLDDQIDELNGKLDLLEKKNSRIYKLLKKQDSRAYFMARLSFHCGYKWEEIADMCDIESSESIRMCVFRAFKELRKKGYPLD